MRDVDRMQEKIEIALEQRQVALLAVAALLLLGVVFAAGVQVGRQIAGNAAAAPAQPAPDDLPAIDRAQVEGAAGAAAKVAPRQPPAREELPLEPEAPAEDPAPAAAAEAPPAPKPAQRPAETSAGHAEPAKGPVAAPRESQPAPGSVRVAVVSPQGPAHAVVQKPSDDEVRLTPPPRALAAYTVQIGASQDKRDAQRLEAKARAAGLKPYAVEADLGAKGLWYRVRVGSFANKDVAQRYRQDVERELRLSAVVMPTR